VYLFLRLTRIIGGTELLVRTVTAVVVGVAPPGLEDAARVVALELIGLTADADVSAVLLVRVVGAVEDSVANLGPRNALAVRAGRFLRAAGDEGERTRPFFLDHSKQMKVTNQAYELNFKK
jgi:hypothetical protein